MKCPGTLCFACDKYCIDPDGERIGDSKYVDAHVRMFHVRSDEMVGHALAFPAEKHPFVLHTPSALTICFCVCVQSGLGHF